MVPTERIAVTVPLIAGEGITVRHRGHRILDDVTLHIEPGEFITLIGPNGAGKSTLLSCLLGARRPDRGIVERAPGLRVGYVPQNVRLNHSMPLSVKRFLARPALRQGAKPTPSHATSQEQEAVLAKIAPLMNQSVHTLSGGEMQSVFLARALQGDPQLLVLDEPAQSLDFTARLNLYRLLESIYKHSRLSILMVSHDLHLVMACSSRVVCLYHHICCAGAPHVVTQNPVLADIFGAESARLLATYQHAHDHEHL